MPQFIEKTPNGLETWIDDHDGPGLDVHYREDFEPILNGVTAIRNEPEAWKRGVKQEFALYASLPPVIIMDLKIRHGIDVFNRDHQKKLFQVINTDYPYLKATTAKHTVKG